jgi:hypothetical protein
LFLREVPVCIACSNDLETEQNPGRGDAPVDHAEILRTLKSELASARWRAQEATREFDTVMSDVPNGTPQPDGLHQVFNASKELTAARKSVLEAHDRLNNFLVRGVIPEHLRKGDRSEGGDRG